jgi:hypothetical protein
MAKMGSLHNFQRAKKLTGFFDPDLPQVVCKLV